MTQQDPQPLPDLAAYLAFQHQSDQEAIAAQTAAGLAILWPALQFAKLNDTTPAWLHAVTLEIEKQFQKSADLGSQLVQDTLWAIEPTADEIPSMPIKFPVQQVQTSMRVTGPVAIKRATGVLALEDQSLTAGIEKRTMADAEHNSTGAGVKHAMNGGREAVKDHVQMADVVPQDEVARRRGERAIGYARFTDSGPNSPCYFCSVLASRGAYYLNEQSFTDSDAQFSGPGTAKVHDHCRCTLRPVFRKEDRYDDRAKLFLSQWKQFTKGLSGNEAMNAFRRNYVPPPPYKDAPIVDLGAVRANRDRLVDLGFGENSPQVRFYDDMLAKLG